MSCRGWIAFFLGVLCAFGTAAAFADPDPDCTGDPHHCDGVHAPGEPGPQGPPGVPGATGATGPPGADGTGGDLTAVSESVSEASNQLDQTITQSLISIGGGTGDGAGATATSGEGVTGDILSPKTSVTFTSPDKVKIENVPNAIAPDIYPTVSCFKPVISGAFSFAGFGASGGGGVIDEDCVKREYIRLAHAMGLLNRAAFMWCQQPAVWEDFGTVSDCLTFGTEPDPDTPDQEHVTHAVADALIEQQAAMLDAAVVQPLRAEVAQVVDSVAGIERRLDQGAAASRRAAANEAKWKESMAERYLDE